MAKTRRQYAGGAVSTTISSAIDEDDTSIGIAATTGWPSGADPFYIVVSPGLAAEEKMLVTRTGSTLTVASGGRGKDGTTAHSHLSGATTYPVVTAIDLDESNEMASKLTTKGDLLTYASGTFARQGVGTNAQVLIADSAQTNGIKWGEVTASGIASNAVEEAKINAGAVTEAKIGSSAVTAAKIGSSAVETAKLADKAVTAAKIGVLTNTTAKTDSFTLALGDENTTILCNKATAMTVTIPTNASVAFAVGSQVSFVQLGAGQVTFAGDTGVTLNSDNSKKKILVQYGVASLVKTATDTWVLFGQLTA